MVSDVSALFSTDLGHADSGPDGRFSVPYLSDATPELGTRKLGIRVVTQSRRKLYYDEKSDVAGAMLAVGDITLKKAETNGFAVTLGGSVAALPVRTGNAVQTLIDDEDAWKYLQHAMSAAAASIDVMQLELDLPPEFKAAPSDEEPEIVIAFDGPVDPASPRPVVKPTDFRPERILIDKAQHGVKVRITIPHQDLTKVPVGAALIEILFWLILIALVPVGIGALVISKYIGMLRGFTKVDDYFQAAGSTVQFASFPVTPFNVVHAKVVIVDDATAIVLGSPFSQSYWDTHQHLVLEPRRGSASGEPIPVHDVSFAVRGPAVKDIRDAYRLHWNFVKPNDLPDIPAPPAPIAAPGAGESIAALQLVRTLNGSAFPPPLELGEKGILEAYLRAIENAKTYIYFENQYFTNETIGQALVAALNDTTRPNLQVILMLNVTPDIPLYPTWQSKLIKRIRQDAGANAGRIGFFTAWSHDPATLGQTKPMIAANYLHTKLAIVDGLWATVGSANLDGASLDEFQLLHALQFADNRNHELNYIIFNKVTNNLDGSLLPATDAIDVARRNLWGEHLGIPPGDSRLASNAANDVTWLSLWKATAERKRSGLAGSPATIDPANGRVLEIPADPPTNAKDFLKAAQIGFDGLTLIEHVRPYSFHDGAWK
jgi:phosphatidylserine/phosphatidylglycerophosphate/cardiolipin synthase-like enzyme